MRESRDLTRQRAQLVGRCAAVADRLQAVLGDARIKPAGVASEVLGASGGAMGAALIGGATEPGRRAGLARRRLRGKIPQLRRASHGRVTEHHRFLLRTPMGHAGAPDDRIERPDHRIGAVIGPFSQAAGRLVAIPGSIGLPPR